ncbi:hypothetical protein [Anaerobutyricum hallii]
MQLAGMIFQTRSNHNALSESFCE